jgi:transcriptional regulator with XRE-family HTH domain
LTTPIDIIAVGLLRERQRAGLSLTEVARRAGIAKSTLSQLEAGNGNPSLETLWALCVALNIPFARLMEPDIKRLQVIRRGEGMIVSATWRAARLKTASAGLGGACDHRAWPCAGGAARCAGRTASGRLHVLSRR